MHVMCVMFGWADIPWLIEGYGTEDDDIDSYQEDWN
jgi:hypothetical protein